MTGRAGRAGWTRAAISAVVLGAMVSLTLGAQDAPPRLIDELTRPFDRVLDRYVRDGFVYYAALKQERTTLDRFTQAVGDVTPEAVAKWPKSRQLAFWINAYNAFVLETVIDNYPIRGEASPYPRDSIRQIPGAFEARSFRAAGRALTLDVLEMDVIAKFGDARALLALGRGSVGGGRLKSEAYVDETLDEQLAEISDEILTRREMVRIDLLENQVAVTPLFSWREREFVRSFADRADTRYFDRSPIERAVLALLSPIALPLESDFLMKNEFRIVFQDYDWRLNDLATR